MKPAPFKYLAATTVIEALEMLEEHGDDARILAGGQSLVPMLNFRIARFEYLVDINRIADLSFIRASDDALRIGPTVRYREIETSPEVGRLAPLLQEATRSIAHFPIRTRGTIGGSISHADPAAEYPAVLSVLGAEMLLRSLEGERWVSADGLFLGPFTTALESNEILVEVKIPAARANQAFGFAEYARRPGDLAIVGVAIRLDFDGAAVSEARISLFGLEGSPLRALEAEAALVGAPLSPAGLAAAVTAAESVPAQSDTHATAALRQHLAGTLLHQELDKIARERSGSDE